MKRVETLQGVGEGSERQVRETADDAGARRELVFDEKGEQESRVRL